MLVRKSGWTAKQSSFVSAALLLTFAALIQGCGGSGSDGSTEASASATGTTATTTPATVSNAAQWKPVASDTWQWQLRGTINTSYAVAIYDIDLFDVDASAIAALKRAGHKVVCYFSAGSSEDWRPDYATFRAADMGNALSGWTGEKWLDVRSSNVRAVMSNRLDLAVSKGCDGVEPDNVDGYVNSTGFPLTAQDQIDFNTFIAQQAHARNLAVALKNDVDQIAALEHSFDFAVNEQCHEKSECGDYFIFTSDNKPVLNAEYASQYHDPAAQAALCQASRNANLRTLVLAAGLDDSYRFSCD